MIFASGLGGGDRLSENTYFAAVVDVTPGACTKM